MKHFAVCLALALTCGVVLSNQWICADAIYGVRKARNDIVTEKAKSWPSQVTIQKLEAQISNFTQTIFNYCPSNDSCSFSKNAIELARESIAAEKSKSWPSAVTIEKLENEVNYFKQAVNRTCDSNQTCAFYIAELNLTRAAINAEKAKSWPSAVTIDKLETVATSSSDAIFNTCNYYDLCSFLSVEVRTVQGMIAAEKSKSWPSFSAVSKLEAYLNRLNSAQNYRCYGSRFLRAVSSVKLGETTCNGAKTAFDVAQKVLELLHKAGTNGPKVQQALAAVGEAQALVRRLC